MSVKLEDIAKKTGFSISTVSRVLSNSSYRVSDQIREKVLRAAEAVGYEPNIAASGTLAACGAPATEAPLATEPPPVAATTAPAVVKGGKVRIAVGGWAEQNLKDLLAVTEFTKNTGIDVEVVLRTDTTTRPTDYPSSSPARPAPGVSTEFHLPRYSP